MNRRNFLTTSAVASTSLVLSPPLILYSCTDNENVNEIIFEVVMEIGLTFLEGCTYAVCMAGVRNHAVCTVVSKVMSVAAELAIDKVSKKIKGKDKIGNGRKIDWEVETRKKGRGRIAKIYFGLSMLIDTIDILNTIGCPDGNCNGRSIDWDYVGIFGVGKYPQTAQINLSRSFLKNLSEFDRCILRNEMYARHGYRFQKTSSVINYFNNQEWYRSFPENLRRYDNDWGDYVYQNYFNSYEKYNLQLIKEYPNGC